jgi:hypothetical protein
VRIIVADLNPFRQLPGLAASLIVDNKAYSVSCSVRTLRDGTRLANEVVCAIPSGKPYDPQPFPSGVWRVTGLAWQKEKRFDYAAYGPVKILTDAWRMVRVWALDEYGDYLRETDELVRDEGYWLHYSVSKTTLGCLRLGSPSDAVEIADIVQEALSGGEIVELEV